MALEKLPFTVNVASLRQDTDAHILGPNAGMLQLRNVIMDKTGSLTKRRGATSLSGSVMPSGNTLPPVWQLGTHKGALVWLSEVGDHPLVTYSPYIGRWAYPTSETMRGPLSVSSINYGIDTGFVQARHCDIAVSGNYACYVYCPTSSGISFTTEVIVDLTTGKPIYKATMVGISPRVIAINGFFVVFAASIGTNLINIDRWTISTLATVGAPVSTTSQAGATPHLTKSFMDVVPNGSNSVTIAYLRVDNTVWTIDYTPSTNTAAAQAQFKDAAAANVPASQCLAWISDTSSQLQRILLVADSGTGVKGHLLATSSTTTTSTAIDAAATTGVRNVVGETISTTSYNVYYETLLSGISLVKSAKNSAGVVTLGTFQRSVGLASKPWKSPADSASYAVFTLPSATQPSYFVMQLPADPVATVQTPPQARFLTWRATGTVVQPPSLATYGSGFLGAFVSQDRLESSGLSGQSTFDAVSLIRVGFNDTLGRPLEAADFLYAPGATLNSFDGKRYCESDFHIYPEPPTAANAATGGGLVVGKTYSWVNCYRLTDGQGRIRRSAPSLPVSLVITAGNDSADLAATTNRLTSVKDVSIRIEWYRTEGDADVYYKVTDSSNDVTVDTVALNDGVSDVNLVRGELLYSQPDGGELEFEPPPPMFALTQFDGRMFGINSEDRRHLPFSTQFIPGETPRWNETLDIVLNDQYGELTGLASMDDKLILFKQNAIYVLTGDGPDINGNGAYRPPQLIATGYGLDATQVLSIITTVHGVWFMGPRGVCLLKRDLSVEFIGSPVGGSGNLMYNYVCTGAAHVATQGHVRWFAQNDVCICYDYDHQVWSTFDKDDSGKLETDAVIMWPANIYNTGVLTAIDHGKPSLVRVFSGVLWGVEDPTRQFEQQAVPMTMAVTFPWLALAGLNGYERLYRIQGVGSVITGTNGILITIAYDYNDADVSATQVITPAAPNWLWDARPLRPLARAFKVKIQEGPGAADVGFTIAGLTFVCGAKKGLKRLAPSARAV